MAAPPVYRPVAPALQRQAASPVFAPKSAAVLRSPTPGPQAPPVFRPVATASVQRSLAPAVFRPPSGAILQQCHQCNNFKCKNGSICGGRKTKFAIGQHGAKTREQRRLGKKYKTKVTGSKFESEHAIGFEPLNQTSGDKRGGSAFAKKLEKMAHAYQEIKPLHRDHTGTGNSNDVAESGFTARTYRDAQRNLLEEGNASAALQINQLDYAFNPDFQALANTTEGQIANESYETMVGGMNSVSYANGNGNTETVPVTKVQQAELLAARKMAQLGRPLTGVELAEIYEQVGMDEYW